MTNNPNYIEPIESSSNSNKSSKFVENTKRAVRKVLTTAWIVTGSMLPITTSTAVPANANNIIRIEPATSTTIKTVGQWTTADLFTAFDKKDNEATNNETPENNYIEPAFKTGKSEITTTRWGNWINENNNSTIDALGHNVIEVNNIRPVDILPIIWQIEAGDKKAYEHIEHLRIAEATRIRDMMREYGAWDHSAEEYKQLMNRLNTGMTLENPKWYDNYETIWWEWASADSNHAHDERDILNTLINHANLKVANPTNVDRFEPMQKEIDDNPNNIYIFWNSAYAEVDKETFWYWETRMNTIKQLCKSKNFLIFRAWWNIEKQNWILKNQILHENTNGDEHWVYSLSSITNWRNDSEANTHLIVTIWTNADWDIDQTNETYESSKFPVWFHPDVLFAWRTFPKHSINTWTIWAEKWKYATSYVNYTNVAVADLCFQMFAEVKDVDELLEMIRNSSDLRDYIRFDLNGDGDTKDIHDGQPESQPLILMNPAWFFQKYLMPTSLPTNLRADETTTLDKGYYHGVVYQIPGAEVNINGQWIPFTDNNKDLILAQNPMTLEWRLNGELLNNHKPGDIINGQIIVVDDKWNGLNITKDFSINIEEANGINDTKISTPNDSATWYTINGYRLDAKPTKPGIYIVNGQKVIIK